MPGFTGIATPRVLSERTWARVRRGWERLHREILHQADRHGPLSITQHGILPSLTDVVDASMQISLGARKGQLQDTTSHFDSRFWSVAAQSHRRGDPEGSQAGLTGLHQGTSSSNREGPQSWLPLLLM